VTAEQIGTLESLALSLLPAEERTPIYLESLFKLQGNRNSKSFGEKSLNYIRI
jgi:hypothetical protein